MPTAFDMLGPLPSQIERYQAYVSIAVIYARRPFRNQTDDGLYSDLNEFERALPERGLYCGSIQPWIVG